MRSIAKFNTKKTKKTKNKYITTLIVACYLITASVAVKSVAQDISPNVENMYRVEMIVFKRGNYTDDQYANSEIWPKNIDLYYPENIQSLFTPDQLTRAINQYKNSASLYDLNSAEIEERIKNNSIVTLPVDNRSLRQEARRIMARREIRVLFHEVWDQQLDQNGEKIYLAVTGGEQFGKHFQLEGSVRIHRSRFLHIKTKLWLSAFEANQGQELQYWPELPGHPVPLGSEFNQRRSILEESSKNVTSGRVNTWSDIDRNLNLQAELSETLQTEVSTDDGLTEAQQAPRFSDDPFIVKNIVTLNQSRRMRSNEIHYIDHPRMGVIVKIIPLEATSTDTENLED